MDKWSIYQSTIIYWYTAYPKIANLWRKLFKDKISRQEYFVFDQPSEWNVWQIKIIHHFDAKIIWKANIAIKETCSFIRIAPQWPHTARDIKGIAAKI